MAGGPRDVGESAEEDGLNAMAGAAPTARTLAEQAALRQDLLAAARDMVPTLRSRALEADRNRGIPVETHLMYRDAGFYRIFQPARYGGYEMPVGFMVEICAELGRGCGSSAWVFSNLAGQSTIVGTHSPRAQDELWGVNPEALVASSYPTKGGTARRVDGGIVVDGLYSFASGIDFADWENLQVFIPNEGRAPEHRFALVPKSQYTIVDDWYTTGLSGTGSRSVRVDQVFIPEYRLLDVTRVGSPEDPVVDFHPGAIYRLHPMSGAAKFFPGPAIGIARGALERVVEDLKSRRNVTGLAMAEFQTAQARIAESEAEIEAAFALMLRDSDEAMMYARRGEKAPLLARARWRRDNAFAGQLCVRAVERLNPLAGGRGLGRDSLYQLAWRDVHAVVAQITMAWDIQSVNCGRIQVGLDSLDPRL